PCHLLRAERQSRTTQAAHQDRLSHESPRRYRLPSGGLGGGRRTNRPKDRSHTTEDDAVAVAKVADRMNPAAMQRRPVLAFEILERHAARGHDDPRVVTGNGSGVNSHGSASLTPDEIFSFVDIELHAG